APARTRGRGSVHRANRRWAGFRSRPWSSSALRVPRPGPPGDATRTCYQDRHGPVRTLSNALTVVVSLPGSTKQTHRTPTTRLQRGLPEWQHVVGEPDGSRPHVRPRAVAPRG